MIFSLWAHGKFGKRELNTNLYPRQGQEPWRASSNPSRFLTYLAQQARSKRLPAFTPSFKNIFFSELLIRARHCLLF